DRNLLGGAAPFYRCYLCSDGKEMSVGPLEPQFFALMMEKLGLADLIALQYAEQRWGELAGELAATFATQPQHHWAEVFAGTDACVAPVLEAMDAPHHPHNIARATFVEHEGLVQAAPAPRFSRTAGALRAKADAEEMLANWRCGVSSP
ncbi:MAG: CoA transferase, partial [Novosphingobium sp.]